MGEENRREAREVDRMSLTDHLEQDLAEVLDRHPLVRFGGHTPTFVLAVYLVRCLDVFGRAVNSRAHWSKLQAVPERPWTTWTNEQKDAFIENIKRA